MNWPAIRDEVTSLLQSLLRFDTTNPPGNELACLSWVAGVLHENGIECTLLESAPARGNLVARLRGNGSKQPCLLMGHVDVVPVEREQWTHDPFGGELADGYVYGRGALDMKNVDAIQLILVLLLKRAGLPLARDVIFMLNADEETGGVVGARWMQEKHPDLIEAEAGITELGGNAFEFAGKRFFMVQTGEKGGSGFVVRAHGNAGHASQPHPDNAVLKLMRALNRIATADLPIHVSPTMRTYVETIAREAGPAGEPWYGLLEQDSFAATLEALPVRPSMKKMLHSQFHNSLAPTVLSAGSKVNVIPASAECVVDCRIVPGQTRDDVLREVRSLIGDDFDVEFRSAIASTGVEQAGAAHSELWHLMDKGIRKHGDGVVVPFLMTGGTDARFQIKLGTQMFGFTPSLAPIEEYDRIHAHDERVAVSDLEFGVRVLYDVVEEYCAP